MSHEAPGQDPGRIPPACRARGRLGLVVALCVILPAIAGGGCSAIFVNGPPPPCSQSRVVPWIDTGVAAVGALGVVGVATDEPREDLGGSALVGALLFVPLAVGYGISAIWGHRAVSGCRSAAGPR